MFLYFLLHLLIAHVGTQTQTSLYMYGLSLINILTASRKPQSFPFQIRLPQAMQSELCLIKRPLEPVSQKALV